MYIILIGVYDNNLFTRFIKQTFSIQLNDMHLIKYTFNL